MGAAGSWTRAVGWGTAAMIRRRIRSLSDQRWWARYAGVVQAEQLRTLLNAAAQTEIGRRHGFARIAQRSGADLARAFAAQVAAGDYEHSRSALARMRENAEPDVLWPGVVRDWAQTSGTTGGNGQKYIPVSVQMLRSNRRAALDVFAHAARFGASIPDMFAGRLLFLGGSTNLSTSPRGIRTGDLSGIVTRIVRWPLTSVVTPDSAVALMDDWPAKIEAMARQTLHQDVRFISGMASWALVLFQKLVELAGREGGSGHARVRQVWPNLRLFVHGGVYYPPFDQRVREAWSGDPAIDVPLRLEVYPASEGFIAMQDTAGDPGLRLNTDIGIFYEFIPLEEIGRPGARAFTCDQVDKGQRYVLTMTTCAGLWRYIIGDVVTFDTIPPDGPPRLRIVGRHRAFINAFGENLIVEDIETATVQAARRTGAHVGEFTAAPVYPGPGVKQGVELLVEWGGAGAASQASSADPELVERFAAEFDRALRERGVDYNIKRTGDLGMGPAVVTTVPIGTFHRWMASRGKLGGQHKAPRCANNRELVEQITAAAGEHPSHR